MVARPKVCALTSVDDARASATAAAPARTTDVIFIPPPPSSRHRTTRPSLTVAAAERLVSPTAASKQHNARSGGRIHNANSLFHPHRKIVSQDIYAAAAFRREHASVVKILSFFGAPA